MSEEEAVQALVEAGFREALAREMLRMRHATTDEQRRGFAEYWVKQQAEHRTNRRLLRSRQA